MILYPWNQQMVVPIIPLPMALYGQLPCPPPPQAGELCKNMPLDKKIAQSPTSRGIFLPISVITILCYCPRSQILIRGKRVSSASRDSNFPVYCRCVPRFRKFKNYFSRVLNSLSTGIHARRLRYFRFSDLRKCFLGLFIMLNKSFLLSDYVAVHES